MRILLIILLTISASIASESPNKLYSTSTTIGEFNVRSLVVKKDKKIIFETSSGYGGFQEIQWSPDSKYFAVIDHGIKTMKTLHVFEVKGNKVKELDLPDYRLNILGRYKLVKAGRYRFDSTLKWEKSKVHFNTFGSLKDGVSNRTDDPENWYEFDIVLSFENSKVILSSVIEVKLRK